MADQRRRRDRDDEDDEDDRLRIRRPVDVPIRPLVYGVGACLLFCAPPLSLAMSVVAIISAAEGAGDLPSGPRGDAGRGRMNLARTLAFVGMGLSGVATVVAILLAIANRF
jgi:hypothetical protein